MGLSGFFSHLIDGLYHFLFSLPFLSNRRQGRTHPFANACHEDVVHVEDDFPTLSPLSVMTKYVFSYPSSGINLPFSSPHRTTVSFSTASFRTTVSRSGSVTCVSCFRVSKISSIHSSSCAGWSSGLGDPLIFFFGFASSCSCSSSEGVISACSRFGSSTPPLRPRPR